MALSITGNLRGLAKALRRLAPIPDLAIQEFIRLVRTSSRGLKRLQRAVPVETGTLRDSWRVQRSKNLVKVGTVDPAAPWIRYKRKRRYGARSPAGTLKGWEKRDARALASRAYQTVIRRRLRR